MPPTIIPQFIGNNHQLLLRINSQIRSQPREKGTGDPTKANFGGEMDMGYAMKRPRNIKLNYKILPIIAA